MGLTVVHSPTCPQCRYSPRKGDTRRRSRKDRRLLWWVYRSLGLSGFSFGWGFLFEWFFIWSVLGD